MDQLLGLVFLAGYIVVIVALAAGITWAVIRIFPTERNPKKSEKDAKPAKGEANGSGEGQGRLFRRSKRGGSS